MRIIFIAFLCLECSHFACASFFGRGRGTVAERRAALQKKASEEPEASLFPEMGLANAPPNAGLSAESPESIENVAGYQIAMPTPVPAGLNGVYCRGGACQYRVAPPAPTLPPLVTPPPLPIGGNLLSSMEFCRGLSCYGGMGFPGSAALASFNLNCAHLFNDVGGGLLGSDEDRSIAQVHDSFANNVCKKRVGILEVGACPTYAQTFVGAESPKVDKATVGSMMEVCTDTYWWIVGFKQAEIDLKVTAAALPKSPSLIAGAWGRFGSGGVGPSSARGLKWRKYAWDHGIKQKPPATAQQLADDGSLATAFLQTGAGTPPPLLPGEDRPEDTPRGLPKYKQNAPCDAKDKHTVPQGATKYQILPGSPDGAVPPVEVSGDLFTYCSNQFSEIMMGFAQTATETVKMTKGWCAWQSSVTSWVGKSQEFGHPDWTHRTCSGMQNLIAFSLRDELADTKTGLSAQQVCKKIFASINSVHRTEAIVKDAWITSLRGAPASGIPAADDADMKKMMQEAQAYANKIFSKLRGQKAAFEKLNTKKMDMAAFNTDNIQVAPPPAAPDLPSSEDVDPTALLALSVERVRHSRRVGITLSSHLEPWGRSA